MKVMLNRMLALGGICALFGTAGTGVLAQGRYDHRMDHDGIRVHETGFRTGRPPISVQRARHEISILKMTYDHEIRSGHPEAAMRAHKRAKAIRARLRAQRWDSYGW